MKPILIGLQEQLLLFSLSLSITVVLLFLFYSISFRMGLVDVPGGRKKHKEVVPLIGGLSIFIGSSSLLTYVLFWQMDYVVFLLACLALVSVCLIDDKYTLPANHRFLAQFLSIGVMIVFGKTMVTDLGDLVGLGPIMLGWLSIPFTLFALIGTINAVNMMDGVDGLTGCVSFVELGLMLYLASSIGAYVEATMIVVFMGAILAFLFFNFPHKFAETRKIFLGDVGSMFIGLLLAWLTVRLTQGVHHYPPVLMLWILALPLMDTMHLIINRKARGVPVFKADRRHIHHMLLQLMYSPRQTTLILSLFSASIGVLGVLFVNHGVHDYMLFLGIIMIFCMYSCVGLLLKKRVGARRYKFFQLPSAPLQNGVDDMNEVVS